MIDTRPLWARALAQRGAALPHSRGLQLFLKDTDRLTGPQFLDAVRVAVGLLPMYPGNGAPTNRKQACGHYVSLEALRRAADPGCARCGGSGYYDGEYLEMRCCCTGLQPRRQRSSAPLASARG